MHVKCLINCHWGRYGTWLKQTVLHMTSLAGPLSFTLPTYLINIRGMLATHFLTHFLWLSEIYTDSIKSCGSYILFGGTYSQNVLKRVCQIDNMLLVFLLIHIHPTYLLYYKLKLGKWVCLNQMQGCQQIWVGSVVYPSKGRPGLSVKRSCEALFWWEPIWVLC